VLSFVSYAVPDPTVLRFTVSACTARSCRIPECAADKRGINPIIAETYAYAGLFITAYVITASTSYFVSMQMRGFQLLGGKTVPGVLDPGRLFDSFYWTLMMAAGSGGAGPVSIRS
jgi:hypothetical protein